MFEVGEKFLEVWEHHDELFVITRIENGNIFAKRIFNEEKQVFGAEERFTEDDLLKGNSFCSYLFEDKTGKTNK